MIIIVCKRVDVIWRKPVSTNPISEIHVGGVGELGFQYVSIRTVPADPALFECNNLTINSKNKLHYI